jgi:hypothetical protein
MKEHSRTYPEGIRRIFYKSFRPNRPRVIGGAHDRKGITLGEICIGNYLVNQLNLLNRLNRLNWLVCMLTNS